LNGAAEPGRDLVEIDVFEGTKSVRAKNRCNASRLETADRTFINFLKLQSNMVLETWTQDLSLPIWSADETDYFRVGDHPETTGETVLLQRAELFGRRQAFNQDQCSD
jgi:hypothetical protein